MFYFFFFFFFTFLNFISTLTEDKNTVNWKSTWFLYKKSVNGIKMLVKVLKSFNFRTKVLKIITTMLRLKISIWCFVCLFVYRWIRFRAILEILYFFGPEKLDTIFKSCFIFNLNNSEIKAKNKKNKNKNNWPLNYFWFL